MFVVFDLDGTLACDLHRHHHLLDNGAPAAEPRWDDYYRACVHDEPILPVINVMRALRETGARIEIWTGRSDLVEYETREWFARHGVPHVPMRMRPHGDHSPDVEMKRKWLYDSDIVPDMVFEDRARVVRMWREEGIRCAQVAPGEF